jgi:hypothetical protein
VFGVSEECGEFFEGVESFCVRHVGAVGGADYHGGGLVAMFLVKAIVTDYTTESILIMSGVGYGDPAQGLDEEASGRISVRRFSDQLIYIASQWWSLIVGKSLNFSTMRSAPRRWVKEAFVSPKRSWEFRHE